MKMGKNWRKLKKVGGNRHEIIKYVCINLNKKSKNDVVTSVGLNIFVPT